MQSRKTACRTRVNAASPFLPGLVIKPLSRHPLRLPEATLHHVLARPLPSPPASARRRTVTRKPASIIVVTLDNLVFTRLCLESLLANTKDSQYELLVVDNGSRDATVPYLKEMSRRHPHLRLVLNDRNLGFAPANNQALRLATGDNLVLLNNDTMPTPGWLPGLLRHLADPAIALAGPVTNRAGNEAQIEVPYDTYGSLVKFARRQARRHAGEAFDIRTLTMFCLAMRRDAYERIGALDERFEVGLFEDDDYSMRAREAGLRVLCAEDVFVHHFGQVSFGNLAATGEYGQLFHANRRRWEAKWATSWEPYARRPNPAYQDLVERVRRAALTALPAGVRAIVVSQGDDALLELDGRRAWHFPRGDDGRYAGYHPAHSAEAVQGLEQLRAEGGQYLLLPGTAFWWLDYYADFRRHLDSAYRRIWNDGCCIIYELK